jgi:hypothetical protein
MSSSRYTEHFSIESSHKRGCHYQSLSEPRSHATYSKRFRNDTTPFKNKNEHYFHNIKDFLLYHRVLHTLLFKDCVFVNVNMINHDIFTDDVHDTITKVTMASLW